MWAGEGGNVKGGRGRGCVEEGIVRGVMLW